MIGYLTNVSILSKLQGGGVGGYNYYPCIKNGDKGLGNLGQLA